MSDEILNPDWKNEPVAAVEAVIENYRTRTGDKSIVLTISTQETNKEIKAEIMDMQNEHVFLFFSRRPITNADIVETMPNITPSVKKEAKSKSKILRDKIFKYWKAQKLSGEFEPYYDELMDKFIVHIDKQTDKLL